MALSYVVLCACLAEIGSAIPCKGGNYGLSRVVLGFYVGFMVGALQLFEFILYASAAVLYISQVFKLLSFVSRQYVSFPFKS